MRVEGLESQVKTMGILQDRGAYRAILRNWLALWDPEADKPVKPLRLGIAMLCVIMIVSISAYLLGRITAEDSNAFAGLNRGVSHAKHKKRSYASQKREKVQPLALGPLTITGPLLSNFHPAREL